MTSTVTTTSAAVIPSASRLELFASAAAIERASPDSPSRAQPTPPAHGVNRLSLLAATAAAAGGQEKSRPAAATASVGVLQVVALAPTPTPADLVVVPNSTRTPMFGSSTLSLPPPSVGGAAVDGGRHAIMRRSTIPSQQQSRPDLRSSERGSVSGSERGFREPALAPDNSLPLEGSRDRSGQRSSGFRSPPRSPALAPGRSLRSPDLHQLQQPRPTLNNYPLRSPETNAPPLPGLVSASAPPHPLSLNLTNNTNSAPFALNANANAIFPPRQLLLQRLSPLVAPAAAAVLSARTAAAHVAALRSPPSMWREAMQQPMPMPMSMQMQISMPKPMSMPMLAAAFTPSTVPAPAPAARLLSAAHADRPQRARPVVDEGIAHE